MRYFEPFETEIRKQVFIKDISEDHVTDKTIMRSIAKNDNFSHLDLDNILINKRDIEKTKIGLSSWIINEDSSVWVILGKAIDMNGDKIPNTYNLLLIGKLKEIDIDMETINHNKTLADLWNKKSCLIEDYQSLVTYIYRVMDRPFRTYKDGDSVYANAKLVLEKYVDFKSKAEKKIKLYKYLSVIFGILFAMAVLL